jgi:hypothetical protein
MTVEQGQGGKPEGDRHILIINPVTQADAALQLHTNDTCKALNSYMSSPHNKCRAVYLVNVYWWEGR